MLDAVALGALGQSALLLSGILVYYLKLPSKVLGWLGGFGAGALLVAITVASAWSLATRVPLKVDVIRDRSLLAREADDGRIENVYTLKIMNTTEEPKRYALSVEGLDGIEIAGERIVEVDSAKNQEVTVVVRVPPESAKKGANTIYFDIKAQNHDKIAVHEKATFLMP